ncbi:MAG: isocitrate/isopropylmalate dehydrogenase family protein [Rhodospirillaceae bacterium]|jgi:3-isopropylmalate dehydrogenase|nr:isocitrate/isopropylmalate dehydrogenase family protein [Rhodospirillales bacterium]MBT3904798.1 isocitrate/isopropylmalate dehydrogenase family protein [Rhodospirillaceae bacterium]MBT4700528.1 isocitrate/isopropylmalate dehydrogenase family protein [Rhodospirillaceae bacterium]MBT5035589.1 isocitrate/isopropylmalate dehydrogenase family protein [Rhodospirillaceae bacterium]MBT6219426.1 isocitrate/isopropylmalate dehydrogenase family protein [Rhodospirillaceae bacterium]
MKFAIGILEGDDIGLEVVPECVKVMKAAAARTGLEIDWQDLPIGAKGHETHGHTMPEFLLNALKDVHGFIQGPIGHAAYPKNDPTWVTPRLRKIHQLFASVKPVKSYSNLPSIHEGIDIVFLREVTEGLQSHTVTVAETGEYRPNDEITIATRIITRTGSRRVIREAFEIARTRERKKVTVVHKDAVFKLACGMFMEEARKLAVEYPDVEFDDIHVDTIAMKLVMEPQIYDVVVTTNQFGDILTDLGAGLVGGLGLAPGLCVGDTQAMAQATHGSAPDIAGQNIANPYAMIISGKMLLDWLGRKHDEPKAIEAANLIDKAVDDVIAEATHLTGDLGGTVGTREMGDAIAGKIVQ